MNRAFSVAALLLAAVPTLAGSPKARHAMLPVGSRPPDFTLPADVAISDGGEQPEAVRLHSFLHRKRIIVVFSPPTARLGGGFGRGYAERDLVVLAVLRPGEALETVTAPPLYALTDATGAVGREYGAGAGQTMFYLIGKDGTIKLARHEFPSDRELFGVVDAMPMRQEEMRGRKTFPGTGSAGINT